jgi:hypothetical protein
MSGYSRDRYSGIGDAKRHLLVGDGCRSTRVTLARGSDEPNDASEIATDGDRQISDQQPAAERTYQRRIVWPGRRQEMSGPCSQGFPQLREYPTGDKFIPSLIRVSRIVPVEGLAVGLISTCILGT